MNAFFLRSAIALLIPVLPSPLHAGKLDLDLYASIPPINRETVPSVRPQWIPGDPRNLQGQSPFVTAFSQAGYASMGLMGLMQNKNQPAMAAGFGAVALWQSWLLFHNEPGAWKPKELEILGMQVTRP